MGGRAIYSIPFPRYRRAVFERNTLVSVICQIRFPKIFKIERDLPVEFQESIRSRYPITEEQNVVQFELQVESSGAPRPVARPTAKQYNFLSADRVITIGLASESFSVVTNNYSQWEEFIDHVMFVTERVLDVYRPDIITRIGLRYQNLIDRVKLGIDEPWSSLLSSNIYHSFDKLSISDDALVEHRSATRISLDLNKGPNSATIATVLLQHGLALDPKTSAVCYLIDADFADTLEEAPDADNIKAKLGQFNFGAGAVFNWAISEHLRDKLGPRPI